MPAKRKRTDGTMPIKRNHVAVTNPDISTEKTFGIFKAREQVQQDHCYGNMYRRKVPAFEPPTTLPTPSPVNANPHVNQTRYDHWNKQKGEKIEFTEDNWTPETFADWPEYHLTWNYEAAQAVKDLPPRFVRLSDCNLAKTCHCLSKGIITSLGAALLWPADFGPGGTVRYGRIPVGTACKLKKSGTDQEETARAFNSQDLCGEETYAARLLLNPNYRTTDPWTPEQAAQRLKELVEQVTAGPNNNQYPRGRRIAAEGEFGHIITEHMDYDYDRLGKWERVLPPDVQADYDKWCINEVEVKKIARKAQRQATALASQGLQPVTTTKKADDEKEESAGDDNEEEDDDDNQVEQASDGDDEVEESDEEEQVVRPTTGGKSLEMFGMPPSKKAKTAHYDAAPASKGLTKAQLKKQAADEDRERRNRLMSPPLTEAQRKQTEFLKSLTGDPTKSLYSCGVSFANERVAKQQPSSTNHPADTQQSEAQQPDPAKDKEAVVDVPYHDRAPTRSPVSFGKGSAVGDVPSLYDMHFANPDRRQHAMSSTGHDIPSAGSDVALVQPDIDDDISPNTFTIQRDVQNSLRADAASVQPDVQNNLQADADAIQTDAATIQSDVQDSLQADAAAVQPDIQARYQLDETTAQADTADNHPCGTAGTQPDRTQPTSDQYPPIQTADVISSIVAALPPAGAAQPMLNPASTSSVMAVLRAADKGNQLQQTAMKLASAALLINGASTGQPLYDHHCYPQDTSAAAHGHPEMTDPPLYTMTTQSQTQNPRLEIAINQLKTTLENHATVVTAALEDQQAKLGLTPELAKSIIKLTDSISAQVVAMVNESKARDDRLNKQRHLNTTLTIALDKANKMLESVSNGQTKICDLLVQVIKGLKPDSPSESNTKGAETADRPSVDVNPARGGSTQRGARGGSTQRGA